MTVLWSRVAAYTAVRQCHLDMVFRHKAPAESHLLTCCYQGHCKHSLLVLGVHLTICKHTGVHSSATSLTALTMAISNDPAFVLEGSTLASSFTSATVTLIKTSDKGSGLSGRAIGGIAGKRHVFA